MKEKNSLSAKKSPMSAILGLSEVDGYNQHAFTLAAGLYLHHSVHVTEKNLFNYLLLKVSLEIHCSYLSPPANGRTDLSAGQIIPDPDGFVFSFGSVVTFSCDPGYDVRINNRKAKAETVQVRCGVEGEQEEAGGVWSSQLPTCQRK